MVREAIERAWQSARLPSGATITAHRCLECDDIAAHFAATDWRSHTDVKVLRKYEAAIALFTAEAFAYFLPAFMIATLEDPETADVIPDSILHAFEPSEEFQEYRSARLSRLTGEQRSAVIQFFGELVARSMFESTEIEAAVKSLGSPAA